MKALFKSFIILGVLTTTACSKSYNCECRENGDDSIEATYSIKEKSKSKATDKCNSYEAKEDNPSKQLNCELR